MKSIITKRLGLTAGLTGALFAAGSLQAQTFEPGIDFTADVVSNYIFRGDDVHFNKFNQDGKAHSSFNMAPAFQPSLTFKFAEGWSLNIWGSFAMTGRADKDTDGLFQTAPGDSESVLAQTYIGGVANGTLDLRTAIAAHLNPALYTAPDAPPTLEDWVRNDGVPGFYKEANGLKRNDEVDLTLSYSTSSKLGTMTGGIVSYNYTNITQQLASDIEMFAGFSPAALPEASLTTYVNVATPGKSGSTYTSLAYSKAIELGKDSSLTIAPSVGYATSTLLKIQGFQNANLPVTFALGGFHIGITGVYRMDTRFFQGFLGESGLRDTSILGETWLGDDMIADPSKSNGIANTIVNAIIDSKIVDPAGLAYSYTPKQHVPKLVYYYTIGYTMSF